MATLRRWTGVAKAQAVAEMLQADFVGGMDSVIVFALHRDVMQTIGESLGCPVLNGDTKERDRQGLIDAFQAGELRGLVCQLSVASTALTLTRAAHVVFAESSWVPADMQQAAKRCHRIGQGRPVLARVVSLAGSIDTAVDAALTRKAATIAQLEFANCVA
jgi:SWI/SNF-related matrix-associated actin-dependent regulator of chromatin subfamily A-like protein 1